MGLFDSSGEGNQDEVVIQAPEDDRSEETRLGKQVESDLIGESEESDSGTSFGRDIDLEDIHRQNETIIDLLENLVDSSEKTRNKSSSRKGGERSSGRKSGSRGVSDGKNSEEDSSIGEGMNELL